MNFPPPGVGSDYGRATPSLRHNQRPANSNESNPAERHLPFAESRSDNWGQRCQRAVKSLSKMISPESDLFLKPGDLLFQRGNTIEYVGIATVNAGPANA